MVPEHYRFLLEMPLTTSGKINEKALPEFQLTSGAQARSLPPQTPLQARLAESFAKLLGSESVGIQDDFFELGGNSLKAIQLLAGVEQEFGVKLLPREFFKQPTVKGLEHAIEASRTARKD
jgi:acyl carrier protein